MLFLGCSESVFALAQKEDIPKATPDVREAFEAEYRQFLAGPLFGPDTSGGYRDLRYSAEAMAFWERMKARGPAAIPYLVEKLIEVKEIHQQSERAFLLSYIIQSVARRRFTPDEWPGGKIGPPPEGLNLLLSWWQAGQKGTTQRFQKLYADWKRLKVESFVMSRSNLWYEDYTKTISLRKDYSSVTQPAQSFDAITCLGPGALPPMIDKLRAGDYDVLPFIAQITEEQAISLDGHEGTLEERARRCLDWWDKNKERWTIPFPDVAEAGKAPGPPPHQAAADNAPGLSGAPPQSKPDKPAPSVEPPKAANATERNAEPRGTTAAPPKADGAAPAPEEENVPPEVMELRRLEAAAIKAAEDARRKAEQARSRPAPTAPAQP